MFFLLLILLLLKLLLFTCYLPFSKRISLSLLFQVKSSSMTDDNSDQPIVAVCVVSDRLKCPSKYFLVSIWPSFLSLVLFFFSFPHEYLCHRLLVVQLKPWNGPRYFHCSVVLLLHGGVLPLLCWDWFLQLHAIPSTNHFTECSQSTSLCKEHRAGFPVSLTYILPLWMRRWPIARFLFFQLSGLGQCQVKCFAQGYVLPKPEFETTILWS